MGNKTIYVSQDAEPIFEEAKTLAGGNLSSVIVSSLTAFIKKERLLQNGFDEICIIVGEKESPREIRFLANHILDWTDSEKSKGYKAYRTPKEQIAIVKYPLLSWDDISYGPYEEHDRAATETFNELKYRYSDGDFEARGVYEPLGNAIMLVKPKLDDFLLEVPVDLIRQIESALLAKDKPVEYLDI